MTVSERPEGPVGPVAGSSCASRAGDSATGLGSERSAIRLAGTASPGAGFPSRTDSDERRWLGDAEPGVVGREAGWPVANALAAVKVEEERRRRVPMRLRKPFGVVPAPGVPGPADMSVVGVDDGAEEEEEAEREEVVRGREEIVEDVL